MRAIESDDRAARLEPVDRAILDFAIKLTRTPGRMEREDVERLRRHGLDDATIHDVVQVVAVFNYYNRIADGLGVDDEPEWT